MRRGASADCYAHFERDGQPCTGSGDGVDRTQWADVDECFQGACGTWTDVDTVINSEAERLQWVASDAFVTGQGCSECSGMYPMYLAADPIEQHTGADSVGGVLAHGVLSSFNGIHSYMAWRNPAMYYTGIRMDTTTRGLGGMTPPSGNMGDMRGRALFMSKVGTCSVGGQWSNQQCSTYQCTNGAACTAADNHIEIRSEAEYAVTGFSKIQVFVPQPTVTVSGVRTHSTRQYTAEPISVTQNYYTDRQ